VLVCADVQVRMFGCVVLYCVFIYECMYVCALWCMYVCIMQAQVYGAGYPSLPTMSVEEFYEQKYKQEMAARYRGRNEYIGNAFCSMYVCNNAYAIPFGSNAACTIRNQNVASVTWRNSV